MKCKKKQPNCIWSFSEIGGIINFDETISGNEILKIGTIFQNKWKYDGSSDDVATSTKKDGVNSK